jgi:hypothetical protein
MRVLSLWLRLLVFSKFSFAQESAAAILKGFEELPACGVLTSPSYYRALLILF